MAVINGTTNTVVTTVPNVSGAIAINAATSTIYTGNGQGQVLAINGATNTISSTIRVQDATPIWFADLVAVAADPTTNVVYALTQDQESAALLSAINLTNNTVTPLVNASALAPVMSFDETTNMVCITAALTPDFILVNGSTNMVTGVGNDGELYAGLLSAGTHPITAQYSGDANWGPATSSVLNYVVAKRSSWIGWGPPQAISYGTPLSSTQLDAVVYFSAATGTLAYSPAVGAVLPVGTQSLSVTFTPTNTTDYQTETDTVELMVDQSGPVISWATPAPITYGTALSSTQLDAQVVSPAGLPGTFTYNPPAGTVPPVGTDVLTVTFTPSNPDYALTSKSVPLKVNSGTTYDTGTITLTVNGTTAATATYGQNSTPETVATGLESGVTSGSPVTVQAVNNEIFLQSKATGSTTDYSYSVTANSSNFSQPSFGGGTGNLDGGANQNTTGSTVYQYSITNPSGGSGYQANGNIQNYTDSVMGTWTFGYDDLNRLAGSQGSQVGNQFTNFCWSYDNFGNRTNQEASTTAFQTGSGGGSPCLPYNPQPLNYNANNQVSTGPAVPTYDAAGDVTADNSGSGNTYLYDGDGRICAESPVADGINVMTGYVYNADGQRVAKGTITTWSCDPSSNGFSASVNETDYILDQAGHQLTEMSSQGGGTMAWSHTNVWAGEQLIATYSAITDSSGQADSQIHFYLNDWLGTRRAQTDYAGVLERTCSSLPFGDQESCTPTPTENLFTAKERDTESGNDYFGARYYASSMGRFLSPDPKIMTARHLANPQKWNKYAYVINNPLMRFDPDGMDDYVVFRTASAGMNTKQWAAAEKSITSQKDSQGRLNTFHMVEGSNVTAAAYNKALGTADTHVILVGHTISATEGGHPWGAVLSNSGTDTLTVSTGSGGTLHWPSISDPAFQFSGFNPIGDGPSGIQASSVAIFGCNSFDLASQYSGTSFTGIQSGADGLTAVPTTDAAAAAWVGAGGGQAGDNAANGVLGASQYPTDAGDSVRTQTPPPPPQTQQPNQ